MQKTQRGGGNMERLRQILFYGGISADEYAECQADVNADNRHKVRIYLGIACTFLFIITCLSGGIRDMRTNSLFYGGSFVVCVAMLGMEMMFPEKDGVFLKWLMYGLAALLYLMGICIAAHSPDQLSVSFIAFLLAVPLLFVMPPIQHILNVTFFVAVFIVLVTRTETDFVRNIDIVDSVVFGAVSCIISTLTMMSRYQNFVSQCKLRKVANWDLLTGMKNRNAFENDRPDWAKRCSISLSCVYVDANGLHALNNSAGHEAGDWMLKTVAMEMQQLYGKEGCYRIGGDEFLAFVLNQQDAAVRQKAEMLCQLLKRKGYSVAVGVVTRSAGGIDVEDLIKLAEKRMYSAKEDYYRYEDHAER